MNKVLKYFSFIILLFFTFSVFGAEDNSIIDELNKDKIEELNFDFKLKTFSSCDDLETVMGKYIKDYYKANKNRYKYRNYDMIDTVGISEDSLMGDAVSESNSMEKSLQNTGGGEDKDFSKTNTQVTGVDESDIIKTDGDYIYYYNQDKKAVFIVSAKDSENMKIIKKINLPSNFGSPVLYLGENRLIILASGYSNANYTKRGYWINRQNKTYTIVFDTTDIENPKLLKLYINDGNLRKSRKIGKDIYLLSSNYFNIPYHTFTSEDDIKISSSNIIPKMLEISKTSDSNSQNLKIKGKKLPYKLNAGNVTKCSNIEYVLPDEETLKKFDFNPSYNIISVIDTQDIDSRVKTKVIAGSNSEVYMSLDNLYLTESIYEPNNFRCPAGAMCAMPFYYGGVNNTLVHKMSIDGKDINYENSTIVPGQPLNQYSMDEKDTDFRIITTTGRWGENRSTGLYILDKDLNLKSSLIGLGKGENFQSSRFMGDKLFLVTFKQIDPLFAIDLSDSKNPKVLGELKIPGYSTYLHPYDDNHLIGLGYNTTINKWGGTANNGLKVDLYEINYDKKCGDSDLTSDEQTKCDNGDYKGIIVKQLKTLTIGERGSYSEALNNPRMFIWNKARNILLLPVTLYKNDTTNTYKRIDFFNGLSVIKITKNSIVEEARISHIDTSGLEKKREEECSKYSKPEESECRKLLDGSEYCPPSRNYYIPEYCFADSPIGAYIASKNWEFRTSFIKRALYIGNNIFGISDDKVTANNFSSFDNIGELEFNK